MPLLDDQPLVRLTEADVDRMLEAGILSHEQRFELIDGLLYELTPAGPTHSALVAWLTRHLANAVGEGEVRVQDVLFIEGGWLSPDLIVIEDRPWDERVRSAVLAVEVSVTTRRHDERKVARYARARVGEVWIVEPTERTLTVHGTLRSDGYASVVRHGDGDVVPAPLGAPPWR